MTAMEMSPRANFLPGPGAVAPRVEAAFAAPAVSHRSEAFRRQLSSLREHLCRLTGAAHVAIASGSGTTANDMVAAQLSLRPGRGLVLAHGEFGQRLVDHARRFALRFTTLDSGCASEVAPAPLHAEFHGETPPAWLWCVHCETSSGVLNDLSALRALCHAHGTALVVDCISSLGTLPVDLRGIDLATASSGKGLRAFPGLALVFSGNAPPAPSSQLPRSLDLGLHASADEVPFTLSSNLLAALHAAVEGVDWPSRFAAIESHAARVRHALATLGLSRVAGNCRTSPAVTTLALPPSLPSRTFGQLMEAAGVLVSWQSAHLRARNWAQICLMGELGAAHVAALETALTSVWNHCATIAGPVA